MEIFLQSFPIITCSSKVVGTDGLYEPSGAWNASQYIEEPLSEARVHETVNYWIVARVRHGQTVEREEDIRQDSRIDFVKHHLKRKYILIKINSHC